MKLDWFCLVRSQLDTLSGNLATWIKTNNPGAATDDILGGRQIIPITLPITFPATLPNQAVGDVPTEFTGDFSTAYKVTIRVEYTIGGIDVTLTSEQLCGHRLTFFFTPSGPNFVPVVALDGIPVATGTAQSANITWSVDLTVTHNAFATPLVQASAPLIVGPNQGFVTGQDYYAIVSSFGPTGKGMFDYHNALQLQNEFDAGGWSPTLVDEPALGERLVAMWSNYAAQVSRVSELADRMIDKVSYNYHTIGLAGYSVYGAPYFSGMNLSGGLGGGADLNSTPNPLAISAGLNGGMHGYALEMLAVQQLLSGGNLAVSTTRDLDLANTAGTKIWKGTPSTWTSTVRPALTGYSGSDLSNIDFNVSSGSNVLLAQNAGQTFDGHWTLTGYTLFGSNSAIGVILGAYAGVDGKGPTTGGKIPPRTGTDPTKNDPINFRTGDYYYRREDMKIGSGEDPYSLTFTRNYNSASRLTNSPLGLGWKHNWATSVQKSSDGFVALGAQSPLSAVAAIAEIYVVLDLLSDTALPVDKLVIASLCNQWWVDQLTGNVVTVSLADYDRQYVLLPDGSYIGLDASTLTLAAGAYTLTTPQKVIYSFNASGQLISIAYPFGVTITLTYTSGLLTSISNGLGRTLTLHYTGNYLTSVTDGTGRSVQYAVDVSNNLTTFTDANSKAFTYQYDQPGRMTKYFLPANPTVAIVSNAYDSLSRVQTQANALSQVWTYYLAGSRSEEIDPVGNSSVNYLNSYGSVLREINALGQENKNEFDGLGRMTTTTLPEGNKRLWTYDQSNNILTDTFVAKPGSLLPNRVLTYTYDPTYNKVKTFTDAKSNVYTSNYDSATGNRLSLVKPMVGGLTPQKTWTYNSRGQVLTYTDEMSMIINQTYDPVFEVMLTSTVDYGTSPHLNLAWSIGYNSVGDQTTVTNPRLNQVTFEYDTERRPTKKTDPAAFAYITKIGYDDNGNKTSYQRQLSGTPTWQTYAYSYSLTGKQTQLIDPLNNILTWTFDQNDRLQSFTDAVGHTWHYDYDARSLPSSITDPTGKVSESMTYTYNGLISTVTDARGNILATTYDGFDKPAKTIYPDTSFEENQSYDLNGQVLVFRAKSGNTITMTYDTLNRISTKSPTGQPVVTYGYDLADRQTSVTTPVVSGHPESGTFQFFFDAAGRKYKETAPDGKSVVHQLDANANVTRITHPDGYYITQNFDNLDRLTDIFLNGAATAAAHMDYDFLSRRSKLTYGNGAVVNSTYSDNDDLTQLSHVFSGIASVAFSYGYNASHQENSRIVTDSTFVWHPASVAATQYGSANNVNQYPTVGGISYTYDGNGNLSGDGVWTFTYDTENHLTSATKTGVGLTYVYDGIHRQIQKSLASGAKTRYFYDSWQRLVDYDGSSGALQARYVYGSGLDEPVISVDNTGTITYLHGDKLGSIVATTNASAVVTNKSAFSPYGEGTTTGVSIGFNGQRFDSDAGLYYYKRRFYSSLIGRFLQNDPLGAASGDLNTYAYVLNDPLNHNDELGLEMSNLTNIGRPPANGISTPPNCPIPITPPLCPTPPGCPDPSPPGCTPISPPRCPSTPPFCPKPLTPPDCPQPATPPECTPPTPPACMPPPTPPGCPQPTPPDCPLPTPPNCPIPITPPSCKPPKPQ